MINCLQILPLYSQNYIDFEEIKQAVISTNHVKDETNVCDSLLLVRDKDAYFHCMLEHYRNYNSVFDVLYSFFNKFKPERGFKDFFLILEDNTFSNISGVIGYDSVVYEFKYEITAYCKDTSVHRESLSEVINDFEKFEGMVIWKSQCDSTHWNETISNFKNITKSNIFPDFFTKFLRKHLVAFSFIEENNAISCKAFSWYE